MRPLGPTLACYALLAAAAFLPHPAFAARWESAAGYSGLDEPSYSFLSYRTALGFDLDDERTRAVVFHLGSTHPYDAHGYLQVIARAGVTWEYDLKLAPALTVFGGLGAGAYMDRVQRYGRGTVGSAIPSAILRAGFRLGGKGFGGILAADDYSGFFAPWQITHWIVWHHYAFTLGFYVRL